MLVGVPGALFPIQFPVCAWEDKTDGPVPVKSPQGRPGWSSWLRSGPTLTIEAI